jgi:hypothetical protein
METLILIAVLAGAWFIRGRAALSVETPSPFDSTAMLGRTSYPREVQALAQAIARAEGFFVPGSAPQRAHNPGALKTPGWSGPVTGSAGINVYESDDQGWAALHSQLWRIATGESRFYTVNDSLDQMARTWTGSEREGAPWSRIVSTSLGVSSSATIGEVLA